MRVLVVSAFPPWPVLEGARLVLHHQLRHLAGRHRIDVVAHRQDELDERVQEIPGVAVRLVGEPRNRLRYPADRLWSLVTREPRLARRVTEPAMVDAMGHAVEDHRPDVVHLFGWGTAPLAALLPRSQPTVHSALDSWAMGWSDFIQSRWRRALEADQAVWVRRHERRHYPPLGAVVVVAEPDAADIRARVPDARVEVVPNGVDLDGPPPPAAGRPAVLAFHGNFQNHHNGDAARHLVHRVLPQVRQAAGDARVVVTGFGAAGLGLAGDHSEVRADVPDVRAELEQAAVYVAPMLGGTGLKNKVLEALAVGLPVVATPIAVAGMGPAKEAVTVVPEDRLSGAVIELLGDPARRQLLGEAGRAAVARHHSWESSAEAVEALWVELANRPHPTPGRG